MPEHSHRLSRPLIWGFGTRRSRPVSSLSLASKSSNGDIEESPHNRTTLPSSWGPAPRSMPSVASEAEHEVQRLATETEPLHAPAPVISRSRPETQVSAPQNASRNSHPVPSYSSTAGPRLSQIPSSRRIDRVLQRLGFCRQKKKGGYEGSYLPIIVPLVAFCTTAIICITFSNVLSDR